MGVLRAAGLLATYCFAIQIFCDFSGYSDIAIGSARVMGFDLMLFVYGVFDNKQFIYFQS